MGMKYPKAALFCALTLAGTGLHAGAFRFFGLRSEGGAPELLAAMKADFENGNCTAVAAGGEALFKEKPFSETRVAAYKYMGQCYEKQELPDKAIGVYRLGRGLYPDDRFFPARLAAIYLKAGFYSTAAPLFKEALDYRSDDIEANAGLGRCYAEIGFLARSKDYYARALILGDFKDLDLLKEYARWMIRKRDWGEAELILSKALEQDPGNAEFYALLSRIASGKGDYGAAAARLSQALERCPGNRGFTLERALVLLLAGDADGALGAAGIFLKDGARDPFASLIKGLALHKKGDQAGAKAALAAAGGEEGSFVARLAGTLLEDKGPAAKAKE